jgi:hypothetical protein
MRPSRLFSLAAAALFVAASCSKDAGPPTGQNPPPPPPPPGGGPPPPPPSGVRLYAAGNITGCNPGNHDEATANLMLNDNSEWRVMVLGDMADNGSDADFAGCYGPSWGQFKARSYPVLGNHEYDYFELDPTKPAGLDTVRKANGAFAYWGAQLGNNGPNGRGGYYAADYGSWRLIIVNDNWNRCNTGDAGGTDNCAEGVEAGPGSAYFNWIASELAAAKAANKCTLVAFHAPRFLSSTSAGFTVRSQRSTLWQVLEAGSADVVLNGQEHFYERMTPMHTDGTPDEVNGIRQFNVGTGGESKHTEAEIVAIHPESKVRIYQFGVLRMTLGESSYSWDFLPDDGSPSADSGTGSCH